jgi:hypothetical protein
MLRHLAQADTSPALALSAPQLEQAELVVAQRQPAYERLVKTYGRIKDAYNERHESYKQLFEKVAAGVSEKFRGYMQRRQHTGARQAWGWPGAAAVLHEMVHRLYRVVLEASQLVAGAPIVRPAEQACSKPWRQHGSAAWQQPCCTLHRLPCASPLPLVPPPPPLASPPPDAPPAQPLPLRHHRHR